MARFTTVWGHRFKTPFEFSMQRQQRRYAQLLGDYKPSRFTLFLCAVVPSLRGLLQAHVNALALIDEKTIKLADSDAQVSNLSSANGEWIKLAKKRKEIMKRHGLTDNS
jgi:hypothetical protein